MKKKYTSPYKIFSIIAIIFIGILFISLMMYTDFPVYLTWIGTMSIVTFFVYAYDKISAISKTLRVPEIVLHILALSGGVIGAWFGLFIFRHKRNKIGFLAILLLSSVIHGYIIYTYYLDSLPYLVY